MMFYSLCLILSLVTARYIDDVEFNAKNSFGLLSPNKHDITLNGPK